MTDAEREAEIRRVYLRPEALGMAPFGEDQRFLLALLDQARAERDGIEQRAREMIDAEVARQKVLATAPAKTEEG
jgi:hypothetical protein